MLWRVFFILYSIHVSTDNRGWDHTRLIVLWINNAVVSHKYCLQNFFRVSTGINSNHQNSDRHKKTKEMLCLPLFLIILIILETGSAPSKYNVHYPRKRHFLCFAFSSKKVALARRSLRARPSKPHPLERLRFLTARYAAARKSPLSRGTWCCQPPCARSPFLPTPRSARWRPYSDSTYREMSSTSVRVEATASSNCGSSTWLKTSTSCRSSVGCCVFRTCLAARTRRYFSVLQEWWKSRHPKVGGVPALSKCTLNQIGSISLAVGKDEPSASTLQTVKKGGL